MPYEINVGWDITLPSNTDLSASATQFKFVKLLSTGYIVVCTAATDKAIGVLQDGAAGTATSIRGNAVRVGGVSKVVCGGSYNPGDLLTTDSSGQAVKYTAATVFTGTPYVVSGSTVLGYALDAGASGQDGTILFNPLGLVGA